MKHVCHITTVHQRTDNRIFYKECLSLRDAGYEVSLIAPVEKAEIIDGITIIPIKKHESRLKRMFFTSFWGVIGKVIGHRADLYHFHDPEILPAAMVLSLCGKKMIYDAHENVGAALKGRAYIPDLLKPLASFMVNIVENIAVQFFWGVVTARPDISEKLHHQRKVTLCNFPKLSDLKSQVKTVVPKEKKAGIYVGGLTEIRGIKELITAFEGLDAELWLLGKFSNSDFFEECKNLPGWKNVRYFGTVSPYEIFGYIRQADFGICTFKNYPNHITTLATKPFEYMACGLPLLLSDFPYWKNFFKDAAVYVDPSNPVDIQKGIEKLLSQDQIGKNNQRLIENQYNWEKEVQKMISLYDGFFGEKEKSQSIHAQT